MRKGDECNERCPECGRRLILVSKDLASCPKGHGKLTSFFSKLDTKEKKDSI